ncbi:NAD-dependent epimerase/dehydratase family protein [Streptomyces sp. NBC_00564]|uniref:NAD-dependent epimerase/dehydratase family protein n=1 Tax=Streptomyces sp. NBC_00564 TaxID=2903663 RepID=UPI00352EE90B|nr:NAD-dependent epimerase/dehydratase family protein [Streptomyces sp. NBC_00564]
MRILVLGGTNFIGRHIVETLRGSEDVTVLNRGTQSVPGDDVVQLTADRTAPASVAEVLTIGFDAVVDVSGTEPEHIASTAPVLRALGVSRYTFISSGSVYDSRTTKAPFPETSTIEGDPIWGEYGRAKVECERLLSECGFEELTVLRPPYVYGPGNSEPREQFLWSRLLQGKSIFVPGDGSTTIQFCHVSYLAEVVLAACRGQFEPGVYNVGDEHGLSFDSYIACLAKAAGLPVTGVSHVLDPRIPARDYFPFRNYSLVLETSKIAAATSHAIAAIPLAEGLARTYDWFQAHDPLDYVPTPREEELADGADITHP